MRSLKFTQGGVLSSEGSSVTRTLQRTRNLGVLTLTLLGATMFSASPAKAVPGYEVVFGSSSPHNSSSQKLAVAFCSPGKRVYAVGATISGDETGKVFITRLVPGSSAVHVQATEQAAGFSGNWSVRAEAICGNPVANMQVVTASLPGAVRDFANVVAECPANTVVYGTGFGLQTSPGATGRVFPTLSIKAPTVAQGTEAGADVDVLGMSSIWSVEAYAVCGAAAPGYEEVADVNSALNSTSPKTVFGPCVAPKKVHGSGFMLINNLGQMALNDWGFQTGAPPHGQQFFVQMAERVPTTADWRFMVDTRCAN